MQEQNNQNVLVTDIQEYFPKNNIEAFSNSIVNTDVKTMHDKIEKYDEMDSQQRRNIVRNLPLMIEQMGVESMPQLRSLLHRITQDQDDISKILLQKMAEIGKQLQKLAQFQENIKTLLIPILNFYLNLNQLQAKTQAGKELSALAHHLNDKDRGNYVLKHVIEMAHDDDSQDNRIVAVQLFSNMSECFGKHLCEQFVGLQILSLGEDISFKVRKQAIRQLPIIAKLVNGQFYARLFSFFQAKAKDNSNWAIRKACVDIIIEMGQLCRNQQKQGPLTSTMLGLLKDSNKWVKVSAYKALGPFIYQLKGLNLNNELFTQFCKMADNQVNSLSKDNQIIYSCAYNFPAVLDAVGKEKWESDLWRVYEKLLKNTDKRIKQTLSESLHELAKLVGESLTEKYLFKVFDIFFKDKLDDIKLGVIKHIADFLAVLSESKRQSLVGVLLQCQRDQKKWRIRECISKQLGQILQIYKPVTVFEYLVPILLKFCSDTVSLVRDQAAHQVANFIQKLKKEEGLIIGLTQSIKAFGTSPKYAQRQTFLIMCEKLMNHSEIFQQNFLDIMVQLADDKVVNVKLVLAETVKKHIISNGKLCNNQKFIRLKEKLQSNQDEQVRSVFQAI